jgi:hypothetical protein
VDQNYQEVFFQFLSLLPKDLVEEFKKFKRMQPLSIKIEEVIVFFKRAKDHLKQEKL